MDGTPAVLVVSGSSDIREVLVAALTAERYAVGIAAENTLDTVARMSPRPDVVFAPDVPGVDPCDAVLTLHDASGEPPVPVLACIDRLCIEHVRAAGGDCLELPFDLETFYNATAQLAGFRPDSPTSDGSAR